jgi:hypothetical protein
MSNRLREALRPISIVGALPLPPSLFLCSHVLKFVEAWDIYRETDQKNDESEKCIEEFLDRIEASCLHFPKYNHPKNKANISAIISALMLIIPWEYLPESERQQRLMKIFKLKEFRKRVWDQHLELLNSCLAKNPKAELPMNIPVAMALLKFEDLQNELMALPLQHKTLFVNAVPELVVKKPALYNLLSEDNKRALLQSMLNPQSTLSLKILFNQLSDQSSSSVQTLDQNNTQFQPVLGYVNAKQQLSTILAELSIKLGRYLGDRKVDGLKFSMGFFNSTLSAKKNALVGSLRSDINKTIQEIQGVGNSNHSAKIHNLLEKLSTALRQNEQYHKDHARRISLGGLTLIQIDGPGQLGSYLQTAYDSLKQFQNTQLPEPENSMPVRTI